MITLFKLLLVFAAGYLLTMKVVPFIFVRLGRLCGFRMQLTPLTAKRIRRFKSIRRGYYAFVILSTLTVTSLFLELLVNEKPLYIRYGEQTAYPAVREWLNTILPGDWFPEFVRSGDFGIPGDGPLNFDSFARCVSEPGEQFDHLIEQLKENIQRDREFFAEIRAIDPEDLEDFEREELAAADKTMAEAQAELERLERSRDDFKNGAGAIQWAFLYRHGASTQRTDLDRYVKAHDPNMALQFPVRPQFFSTTIEYSAKRSEEAAVAETVRLELPPGTAFLGVDPAGYDLIPQLAYGFRVSVSFAILVLTCGYLIGVGMGALMGYYGGWIDILVQRFIEIWSSIPFLFTIMILVQIFRPSFWLLAVLLIILTAWISISYLMRGEFYREKARDYVHAAIGTGVSDWKIISKHILPNSLVPIISRAPFDFVGFISALVSLDFLGFGLPADIPSWGALLRIGAENISTQESLVLIPVCVFAGTLFMVVLIGEAVREGFDPKVFSRLR